MPDFGARVIIEGDASKAISELDKLKSSLGGISQGGMQAGKGVGQLDGNMQRLLRGDPVGALKGMVGAMGPIGVGALAAAGGLTVLAGIVDGLTEGVRHQINSIDELADKYQMTATEADRLSNFTKIFDIDANSLARTFRTMARQGLPPTIEGLLQVKKRLDEIDDPTARQTEAFRLMGRGALQLADLLATSSDELAIWAERAGRLTAVTDEMTKQQDDFNRQMAYSKQVTANANVVLFGTTLSLKQQVQMWFENAKAMGAQQLALDKLGIAYGDEGETIDSLGRKLQAAQELEKTGAAVNTQTVDAWVADSERWAKGQTQTFDVAKTNVEAYLRSIGKIPATGETAWNFKTTTKFDSDVYEMAKFLHTSPAEAWWKMTHVKTKLNLGGAGSAGTSVGGGTTTSAGAQIKADEMQHGGTLGGGISLVGEAGPELVIGNTVIPADMTQRLLALGVTAGAHHMMATEGGAGSDVGVPMTPASDWWGSPTKKKKKTAASTSSTISGGGGGGNVMAAISAETAAIVAALPGAQALAQAVTAPMQSQTSAITRSNSDLTDRLDTMIALLQRAATNDGIGRAVRDSMNQRV